MPPTPTKPPPASSNNIFGGASPASVGNPQPQFGTREYDQLVRQAQTNERDLSFRLFAEKDEHGVTRQKLAFYQEQMRNRTPPRTMPSFVNAAPPVFTQGIKPPGDPPATSDKATSSFTLFGSNPVNSPPRAGGHGLFGAPVPDTPPEIRKLRETADRERDSLLTENAAATAAPPAIPQGGLFGGLAGDAPAPPGGNGLFGAPPEGNGVAANGGLLGDPAPVGGGGLFGGGLFGHPAPAGAVPVGGAGLFGDPIGQPDPYLVPLGGGLFGGAVGQFNPQPVLVPVGGGGGFLGGPNLVFAPAGGGDLFGGPIVQPNFGAAPGGAGEQYAFAPLPVLGGGLFTHNVPITNHVAADGMRKDELDAALVNTNNKRAAPEPESKIFDVNFPAVKGGQNHFFIWDAIENTGDEILKAFCPSDFDFRQLDPRKSTKENIESILGNAKWMMERGADPSQKASDDCEHVSEIQVSIPGHFESTITVHYAGHCAISTLLNFNQASLQVMTKIMETVDRFPEPQLSSFVQHWKMTLLNMGSLCQDLLNLFSANAGSMPKPVQSLTVPEGVVDVWDRFLKKSGTRDVTFEAKNAGQSIKAHGDFLAEASPVLKIMLNGEFSETKTKTISIDEKLAPNTLTLFIDLLYCGSSNMEERFCPTILDVLDLAHRWQIGYVCSICERWLIEMMDVKNIEEIAKIALMKNIVALELACRRYVESNKVSFVDMPVILEDLVKSGRSQGGNEPPKKKRRC